MKTFDISKNIILAFIILMSIALNLSAHENTTSLISSDNVSIEKDKKAENISKRNVPTKKILCYERDKKGILDYIYAVLPVITFFLGYFLTLRTSICTDRKREKTIKKELEGNINYLTEKYEDVFKELLENDLSKLKEVKKTIRFEFSSEEFEPKLNTNKKLNIKDLCVEIEKVKYNIPLLKKNFNTVDCLNKLLEVPGFYDILHETKKDISFSNHITNLVNETKNYMNKNFSDLNADQQYYIKRLNRFLLEKTYDHETPKIQETKLTEILNEDSFIYLSDTSWNQYKYVINYKEYIISKAYMLIGEINALSNASIHTNTEKTLPRLALAIIKAKDAIDEAIKKL